MAATIKIKNSSTTGAVPTASDLVQGELAVNVADLGLYTENASGTIVKLNAPSIDDKNTGATKNLTISTAGNLGLGVTPFANSLSKGLDWVNGAGVFGNSNNAYWSANAYYDSAWKYKATAAAAFLGMESGSFRFNIASSGTAGNAITFTEAMRLDASGNLGVGTTSPVYKLDVSASSGNGIRYTATSTSATIYMGDNSGVPFLSTGTASALTFGTQSTERARIDSSGGFMVGTTTNYTGGTGGISGVQSSNNANAGYFRATSSTFNSDVIVIGADRNTTNGSFNALSYYNYAAGAYKLKILDSGNIQNANNSYGALSDIKLKENITDATPKLEQLNQIRVVNYNFIGDTQKQIGVIAQELEQIFPGLVEDTPDFEMVTTTDEDGNEKAEQVATGTTTKSVKYSVFVPMLIKAIQELKAEFDAYKASHP